MIQSLACPRMAKGRAVHRPAQLSRTVQTAARVAAATMMSQPSRRKGGSQSPEVREVMALTILSLRKMHQREVHLSMLCA